MSQAHKSHVLPSSRAKEGHPNIFCTTSQHSRMPPRRINVGMTEFLSNQPKGISKASSHQFDGKTNHRFLPESEGEEMIQRFSNRCFVENSNRLQQSCFTRILFLLSKIILFSSIICEPRSTEKRLQTNNESDI